MPTVNEWIEFFYPFMFDASDSRYISPADLGMAIAVAADYRPSCLTTERQDQAQAHYAAYIADFRQRLAAIGQSSALAGMIAGPIVEKAEGDTRIKYATSATAGSASAIKSQLTGPGTPYAAWLALWEICVPATVEGQAPVRRGAIMTAFG